MNSLTVKNQSGQVVTLGFTGDHDPRKEIVERRIAMGELEKASKSDKSEGVAGISRRAVEDYHTGMVDERGDLLKSVHGGGLDPDADGDALGQPSGSKPVEGAVKVEGDEPVGDSHPDAAKTSGRKPAAKKS